MTSYSFPVAISPIARWVIEFDYSPGSPDVMYLSNGDPGYPGDPEEFAITDVRLETLAEGKWLKTQISLDESLSNNAYIETLCRDYLELQHASDQAEQWELSRD